MVTVTLSRRKILDTSITAFLLIIFGVVPIAVLLAQKGRHFNDEKLQTAYTAVLVLSWPFFCLGGITLLYFWRKGRAIDKAHFSTNSQRELRIITAALISHTTGCVLLFVGVLLSAINQFQQQDSKLFIILNTIAMVLILWIAISVLSVILEVWRSKRSARDDLNQNMPHRQEASGGARPPHREPAEPAFL